MQLQAGNFFGIAADPRDKPLPGVVVKLSGSSPQTLVTNAQGACRAVGLIPGSYTVTAEASGYATQRIDDVRVSMGRTTSIEITLQPA